MTATWLILSVAVLAVIPRSWAVDTLSNIDFLGLGYDAFLGNPNNDLYDPGFRENIMQLTYKNVSKAPQYRVA
jgi:hypothetical protein